MTPLYRTIASYTGPKLAPYLLAVIYGVLLLGIVLLADYHRGDLILYLDLP
jgi:hypothetical protein